MRVRWNVLPSVKRHYRVTLADALSAHERALRTGGLPGIKNINDVQSAIGRPYTGYYRRIFEKAAALLESVATNHGFNDGNKRTAIILTQLLLSKSRYVLVPAATDNDINDAIENFVVSIQ